MNSKITTQNLFKGIFWIRDDLPIEQSEDYCIKIPCDLNGVIDEEISLLMTAKSMSNHNHKIYWNEMMNSSLKKGKPFNYYPRGRVEIKRNEATIFLNSNIYTKEVVNFIVNQYCLTNSGIKKIRVVADNSEHYQCHLDTDTDNINWFDVMKDIDPDLYKKFCGDK